MLASGGSDNLTYLWQRTGTSSATLTGTGTTYALSSDATGNYGTAGTYYFNRYAQDATCTNIAPVADAGTYTLYVESAGPPGTVSTTLCTQCCYDGSAWVDCYVTTNNVSSSTQWSGYSTYYSGAVSDKNGRANFTAITASTSNYKAASAVGLCKALGTGWYLPAYEELRNMADGDDEKAPKNGLPAPAILHPGGNYFWSSTDASTSYSYAMSSFGSLNSFTKSTTFRIVCVWRP
jgi:hypothetical protein